MSRKIPTSLHPPNLTACPRMNESLAPASPPIRPRKRRSDGLIKGEPNTGRGHRPKNPPGFYKKLNQEGTAVRTTSRPIIFAHHAVGRAASAKLRAAGPRDER
ncbi:hypothetical protein B0H13DRAFT_2301386 [Mycena leptocephala]|nr:hypothetical protein B0H13DRAFT_2301386 [Mycena leptocephala]